MRIVFGMVDDKDLNRVMDLLPVDAVYYWTQAVTKRAVPAEKVAEFGIGKGLSGRVFHKVSDAYEAAKADADCDDFIFIGGSSYVVSDLLEYLQ